MPMHRSLNLDFFKTWTPEMAYVLGYIAADGTITIGKRGNHYLAIQSIDRELPQKVQQHLGSSHKISVRTYKQRWHPAYRLQIGSRELVRDLNRLGITSRKSRRLKLPRIPKEYFADFVRGYFDGDGNVCWVVVKRRDRPSVSRHLHTLFTSGSKNFLSMIFDRLRKDFGITGGSLFFSSRAYRLLYAGRDSVKLYKLLYENPTRLALKRKREYFTRAVQNFMGKRNH